MRREYFVIRGGDGIEEGNEEGVSEFVVAVNEYLAAGWQLEGGIALCPVVKSGSFFGVLLAQAVSREVRSEQGSP